MILAFEVANPKYEEAADADKAAAVVEPLPACFQNLLEKKILVNAKRDELAKMKTYIEKDRCVWAGLWSRSLGGRLLASGRSPPCLWAVASLPSVAFFPLALVWPPSPPPPTC